MILKWVAVTWQRWEGIRPVVPTVAGSWYAPHDHTFASQIYTCWIQKNSSPTHQKSIPYPDIHLHDMSLNLGSGLSAQTDNRARQIKEIISKGPQVSKTVELQNNNFFVSTHVYYVHVLCKYLRWTFGFKTATLPSCFYNRMSMPGLAVFVLKDIPFHWWNPDIMFENDQVSAARHVDPGWSWHTRLCTKLIDPGPGMYCCRLAIIK